ncbi:MAG: ABC transporter ATP-binding protein [Cellulosilyticaceae bacterium]
MPNPSSLHRLLSYVFKYKLLITSAIFCTIITVVTNLLGPLLIGNTMDLMLGVGNVNFHAIFKLLVIILMLYFFNSLSLWLLNLLTTKIAYITTNQLRKDLFTKLQTLPLKFYDVTSHGNIMSRFINDADNISDGLMQSISTFLTGVMTIIGVIGLMFSINTIMAIIVMLSAPISYYVAKFISSRSKQYFKAQANILGSLNGYAEEMLSNQKLIKSFSYEQTSLQTFFDLNQKLYNTGVKAQFYSSLTNPSTRVVSNITYAIIGVIGALVALKGSISIGSISSFLLYANIFSKPFNEITGIIPVLQSALASSARIFEIFDLDSELDLTPTLKEWHSPCKGSVTFENVSFAYEKENPLIRNFNLEVMPGERIAIVGSTGAGKTTLINLLMRFYEIDTGDIKIDGISIHNMTRDNLRHNFGMVLQDPFLFSGTIRSNIAYGKPNASDTDIINAAKASGAHTFIRKLSLGYDTPITNDNDSLSVGQKQLLTVTRVMLQNPNMLILDEATSSMDTLSEFHIQKAFNTLMIHKTTFIIAHRLSTIKDADKIIVMEKGNIVECGNHANLLELNGTYANLYYSQFSPT